ncbi:MAG: ankyrin repeat domain-containing protein [Alphaproteobacteria bacterium]|nr:ankyrin repeat domain-containing protein [Alphaproteobacteria bacterium]
MSTQETKREKENREYKELKDSIRQMSPEEAGKALLNEVRKSASTFSPIDCRLLIELGKADLEVKDESRNTPLLRALKKGHTDMAEKIIESGADLTAIDKDGCTALHLAALLGYPAILRTILRIKDKRNVDIDAVNRYGQTPLIMAASGGNAMMTHLLLLQKSNPEAQASDDGMTALMYATKSGYIDTISNLLDLGASTETKNHAGQTALDIAQALPDWVDHKDKIIEMLEVARISFVTKAFQTAAGQGTKTKRKILRPQNNVKQRM